MDLRLPRLPFRLRIRVTDLDDCYFVVYAGGCSTRCIGAGYAGGGWSHAFE